MKELMDWQMEMSGKKSASSSATKPPVRNRLNDSEKIKSYEYDKWDRFNVEEALEDIDYAPPIVDLNKKVEVNKEKTQSIEESLFEKEKGNAYFKKGKFKKAVKCYTNSIEMNRSSPVPLVNRCFAYIKLSM